MDREQRRAEHLLTLSSAARRIGDLVAAAPPVNYSVMRHLLRVSEETMTEALEEAVHAELVKRGDDPFTYVPFDDETGAEIVAAMGEERRDRLRAQLASSAQRVFE
jgi:hypothetical protein